MKSYMEFILTEETKMMLPITTKLGDSGTLIIHGQTLYVYPTLPIKVIDFNLRRNHSSLRGAKDSVAHLLGSVSMYPVVLCAAQRHIWFSSEAFKNDTCAWIALHHVRKLTPYNDQKTTVHLNGGWQVTISVPYNSLKNRLNQAHLLRSLTMQSTFRYSEVEKHKRLMMLYDRYRVEYELNDKKIQLNDLNDKHFSIIKVD